MPIYTYEDLIYGLLLEIGLGITPDGFVYDTDNGTIIQYKGLQIKASIDPNNRAITTDMYTAFDPVFDNKLMQMVLGYYLSKSEAQGYLDPLTVSEDIQEVPYYIAEDYIRTRTSNVTVVCNAGKRYTSKYYFQKGLKYADIILRIGGSPYCDLSKFDSIPEESIIEVI